MKKILFVLFAIAVVGSLCFIQLPSARADETKTFIGNIEQVIPTLGRPPTWTYCKIVVVADNGEKVTFFVMKATAIYDTAGKDTSGKEPLKKGKRVEVKYSIITNGSAVTNGKNGAVSIRYLD